MVWPPPTHWEWEWCRYVSRFGLNLWSISYDWVLGQAKRQQWMQSLESMWPVSLISDDHLLLLSFLVVVGSLRSVPGAAPSDEGLPVLAKVWFSKPYFYLMLFLPLDSIRIFFRNSKKILNFVINFRVVKGGRVLPCGGRGVGSCGGWVPLPKTSGERPQARTIIRIVGVSGTFLMWPACTKVNSSSLLSSVTQLKRALLCSEISKCLVTVGRN